ncbi:MAG: hypothetical protein M1829_002269 [Trizodia sp. TS-e1964]|nr:MAG: hypothetical protein M1829_002269 [Trizodia sp. TS-e1964]
MPSEQRFPSLHDLQQPEKLKELLDEDKHDCLTCRAFGGTALVGTGAYIYLSGNHQLRQNEQMIAKSRFGMGIRRFGIAGAALSFAVLGLYRFVG